MQGLLSISKGKARQSQDRGAEEFVMATGTNRRPVHDKLRSSHPNKLFEARSDNALRDAMIWQDLRMASGLCRLGTRSVLPLSSPNRQPFFLSNDSDERKRR
jgi:hypothetical protein